MIRAQTARSDIAAGWELGIHPFVPPINEAQKPGLRIRAGADVLGTDRANAIKVQTLTQLYQLRLPPSLLIRREVPRDERVSLRRLEDSIFS